MKVEKLIPEVYYSQSRDFSYIGRLMEIIFNYMKTGADIVDINPDSLNLDATTIELVALTLGFESKHKYRTRDLIYVISSFSHLLKKKGTRESIVDAIKLLTNSQRIKLNDIDDIDFIHMEADEDGIPTHKLEVKVPSQMTDLVLLEDLFDYILPAGMLYRFNKVIQQSKDRTTLKTITKQNPEYVAPYDSSFLAGTDEKTYSYVLLTVEPDDWGTNFRDYYIYDNINEKFVLNAGETFGTGTFYKRKQNSDVGTIVTGTVADNKMQEENESSE